MRLIYSVLFIGLFISTVLGIKPLGWIDSLANKGTTHTSEESHQKFSPVVLNQIDQRFFQNRKQNTINALADEIKEMAHDLYYKREPIAPRPSPALEPLMQDAVKAMKKAQKRITKQGNASKAKADREMFEKLYDSVNSLNKRLDPKPKSFTDAEQVVRNKEIQDLLYIPQPAEETEEQQAMYARSNAQSQMLHRLAHTIDRLAVNTQNDFNRKVQYDRMLNSMMHDHLADPRFHDDLHDHLLAHHLSSPHTDDEFQEHLSQHMLYHDIGSTPELEYLNAPKGLTTQSASLPATESLLNMRNQAPAVTNLNEQKSALMTNHMYDVAEKNENLRRDSMNNFAQTSYDKFKDVKKVL